MKFSEYQENALKSAMYPGRGAFMGLCYCGLKLGGEAGEVLEKIGKAWRDHNAVISKERRLDILTELGDELWYIAAMANELDSSLEEVAQINNKKTLSRLERGVVLGEGDNR